MPLASWPAVGCDAGSLFAETTRSRRAHTALSALALLELL